MKRLIWVCLIVGLLGVVCYADDPGYRVVGVNLQTKETVAGHIFERDKEGTVTGVIRDRFQIISVVGHWSGLGMAQVHGDGQIYNLEVVD